MKRERPPDVLFLPAALRASRVVAATGDGRASRAATLFGSVPAAVEEGSNCTGLAFVRGLETACAERLRGLVLLVEEPLVLALARGDTRPRNP